MINCLNSERKWQMLDYQVRLSGFVQPYHMCPFFECFLFYRSMLQELPKLIDGRIDYYKPCFEALVKSEVSR